MTMFAFHNLILLRRINARELKDDTIILKKRTQCDKFATIVTSKSFNVRFKLRENIDEEAF